MIINRLLLTCYFVALTASFCLFLLCTSEFIKGWRLEPTTLLTKISKEAMEYEFGFVDTGYSDYSNLKDEYTLDIQTDWPKDLPEEIIEDIFANAIDFGNRERSLELVRKDPEVKLTYEVWIDGELSKEGKFKVFKFVDYNEPKHEKIVARIGEFSCKSKVICVVKVKMLESPDDFYKLNPRFLVSENEESKGRLFQLAMARFFIMIFGGVFLLLLFYGVFARFMIKRAEKKHKK